MRRWGLTTGTVDAAPGRYPGRVGEKQDEGGREVVCPHCKKTFAPEPLPATQTRHRGFKCPHCRLFVASERANESAAQA